MKITLFVVTFICLNFLFSYKHGQTKAEILHTNLAKGKFSHVPQISEESESDLSIFNQDDLFDIDNTLLNEIDENDIQHEFEPKKSIENINNNFCQHVFRKAMI
ncbi:hypothetical protein [Fluviispira sanaruensis]|uniref:Uncharacterized protein n=1 Tax=Fluviispira sanaruensis TaxID=2493639 RepID=A0A4P2VJH2_FLUSA|nr:hypothetical protein [Fluviispira sanaruensis]BBH51720.1 hypothetical protein JCM31447_01370 [Fluviispira sanaruensis]